MAKQNWWGSGYLIDHHPVTQEQYAYIELLLKHHSDNDKLIFKHVLACSTLALRDNDGFVPVPERLIDAKAHGARPLRLVEEGVGPLVRAQRGVVGDRQAGGVEEAQQEADPRLGPRRVAVAPGRCAAGLEGGQELAEVGAVRPGET